MSSYNHDVFVSFSFKDQPIVEKVVKLLTEEYHIPCWICTEALRGGDHFKGEIVNAISQSKLVLLVQSEGSVASKEVPKEVALALEKNKPIIPFLIDNAQLKGDLEYDLIGIQQIDATKPTLEERVEELACQIYSVLNKKEEETNSAWQERLAKTILVSTPSVIPKKVFCGRDDILTQIEESFKNGERVQFLYGIGGIGKSQIAKQYAKRQQNQYDTVIFATFQNSIESLVVDDAPFVLRPEMPRYVSADGTMESDRDYFKRKLNKIKSISNERTLIIVDNFDVETDEDLSEFLEGTYHVLITTRCDYSRYYPTIQINAVESPEHLKEIFMLNYNGYDVEEDDPELMDLIQMVNAHTYTIELLAQHMENSGQTPSEMIEALKKEGIRSLCEEIQSEDLRKHTAYENLLRMFHLFSLSDEEKSVMMYLSFMPIEGINAREFRKWSRLDSSKIIKELENKSWLIKNTEGIALHPVVRDVVKIEIPADEENCKDFIDSFTDTIDDKKMWQAKLEDKKRYGMIAREIIRRFPDVTPQNEDFYYHAQALYSFNFDAEFAVQLAEKLYDYHLKTYGEEHFKTARATFKRGWVYVFNGYLKNSLEEGIKWLTQADELFKKVQMHNSEEWSRHTMTKTNLSKTNLQMFIKTNDRGYYEQALSYAIDSREYSIAHYEKGDFHYAKIGGACEQLAEAYLAGGELDKALASVDEAIEILYSVFKDEQHVDMAFMYYTKAQILFAKKELDEALMYAQKTAEIYTEYFGETQPKLYNIYCLMGDINTVLENKPVAYEMYEKAYRVAQKNFSPFSEEIKLISEKMKSAI